MRWFKWLTGTIPPTEKERLKASGLWGATPETLHYYNLQLEQCTYKQSNRRVLRDVHGNFQTGNVEDLILLTHRFAQEILQDDYLPELVSNIWFGQEALSLDGYLRTREGGFLSVSQAAQHLSQAASALTEAVQTAVERKSANLNYYRRGLEPLIRELLDVEKHLLAAGDTPVALDD